MAKVLIVYQSKSGNTEKMAKMIGEAVEGEGLHVEIKIAKDTTPEDMRAADGIIVGSPTYYGVMGGELKYLFDRSVAVHGKLDGKVGGAFATAAVSGFETTIRGIHDAMLIHGMVIQGDPSGNHYGPVSIGEPEGPERESCRRFGERFAQLVMLGCGTK